MIDSGHVIAPFEIDGVTGLVFYVGSYISASAYNGLRIRYNEDTKEFEGVNVSAQASGTFKTITGSEIPSTSNTHTEQNMLTESDINFRAVPAE